MPSCNPSSHAPQVSDLPAARRTRAAVALSLACEKQAREPSNPLATRERALIEAGQHLAMAWAFLTTWTTDAGHSDATARAAEFIGRINRRLPLLAAMLRAESGRPVSFGSDAVEAALWPATPPPRPPPRPSPSPKSSPCLTRSSPASCLA